MRNFWVYFWVLGALGACSTPQAPNMVEESKVGVNPPPVISDIFISPEGWQNLIRYENQRLKMCLDMEKRENFEPDKLFLGACEINQFSFVASEVEVECAKVVDWKSSICDALYDWQGGNVEFWDPIFLGSMNDVLQARQYNPWQIIKPFSGREEKVAVTHLQKGIIFVEISVQLYPYLKESMSLTQKVAMTRIATEMGLLVEDPSYYYFPTLKVITNVPGLTDQKMISEIVLLDEDGNETGQPLLPVPVSVPEFGRAENFYQLSKPMIESIKSAPALLVVGYLEGDSKSGRIFSFKLKRGKGEAVLDEVVAYFEEVAVLMK